MKPSHRQFDTIACDLIGPFTQPSSKGNLYLLMYICLFAYFPRAIFILDKSTETLVQAICIRYMSLLVVPYLKKSVTEALGINCSKK